MNFTVTERYDNIFCEARLKNLNILKQDLASDINKSQQRVKILKEKNNDLRV